MDARRLQMAGYALAAIALVVGGAQLMRREAPAAPAPVAIEDSGATERGSPAGRRLFVHVAGAVRRPGLYRVPAGSRVARAMRSAGGATPRADLAAVNLAAKLEDGQQVVVPAAGAAGGAVSGVGAAGGAAPNAGGPISLASATAEELDQLDGIGPTLAERIIEYRDQTGGLRSVDELREVDGIGDKRFESLREAVRP